MGIRDLYPAYCLDEAVWTFGRIVQNRIDTAAESQGKNDTKKRQEVRARQALARALGQEPKFAPPPSPTVKS